MRPIKIGNKLLGKGHNCYIIAEIGSNFDGNFSKAKKLIKIAKECGADAAKFQNFKTEELLSKKGFEKKKAFQSKWKKSVWGVYQEAELPRTWHKKLSDYAKKIGIDFFTSPWDFEAVDLLIECNAPAVKVGSGDITYHEILKKIAATKKPIFLSTGASTMKEIEKAIKVIKAAGNKKIILMHSVTQYPSPIEDANVNVIKSLRDNFNLNVGYSDHTLGTLVPLASVALGAVVIEKHFSLNPKSNGPDHPHSMDPKSFCKMINDIRILEKILGDGIKKVEKSEKVTRIYQRRGIWTTRDIKKGEKFTSKNVKALRPAIGSDALNYNKILRRKATKRYKPYESVK